MAAQVKDISERKKKPQDLSQEDIIWTAKVVANYGDLGLTNTCYFDILSRFLIVMIEPCSRMPTFNHCMSMFYIVQRPRELWVDVDGGVQANISDQRRMDSLGNINRGAPTAYSWQNIPAINRPYRMGEVIKVKKLRQPHFFYDNFFKSEFPSSNILDPTKNKYNTSYLNTDPPGPASVSSVPNQYLGVTTLPLYPHDGLRPLTVNGIPYSQSMIVSSFKWKPSYETKNNNGVPLVAQIPSFSYDKQYIIGLNKQTFEVFWRSSVSTPATVTDPVILAATNNPNTLAQYLWRNVNKYVTSSCMFSCCVLEDTNQDNKTREPVNDCMPLVVTNPATYPTPKSRQAGFIKFDPTFSLITTPVSPPPTVTTPP